MNKTTFALIAGLLIFSAGGMQGRLGSLLAVFIDPASLQDMTTVPATPPTNTTPGGVTPVPSKPPGPLNQCDPGYTFNYLTGMCEFSGAPRRHA